MHQYSRRVALERVLLDMNTQCDFLLPRGAVPVSNRAAVVENVRRLMNWARLQRLPVISTLDCHRPGEPLGGLPPYCMDRSPGQKKLPFTLLPRRVVLYGDNSLDVPNDPFRKFRQVIVTKRNRDFLSNPKADRLVNALDCEYFLIFGMVAEHCIKAAALGLMARQRRVAVVSDACGYWSRTESEQALRQIEAKGAVLVATDELISGTAEERLRAALPARPALEDDEVDVFAEIEQDRFDLEARGRKAEVIEKRRPDPAASTGVAHRRDVPSTSGPVRDSSRSNGNGHGAGPGNGKPSSKPIGDSPAPIRSPKRGGTPSPRRPSP